MTSVTVSGSGNAVTSASYSSSTRQLTLTKGSSFMPSTPTSIELNSGGGLPSYGGFIDFHYHDSNGNPTNASGTIASGVDYSSRIIEDSPGRININSATFKSGTVTASKFVKSGSSDSYVLLGGGGTKALSEIGGGGGDVYGPASSTNNAVARFDGATGKIIKNSGVTIDNNGYLTASRLTVYANNNGVTIGSQNSSFCHIYNSASIPFIFNNAVAVTGDNDLGTTSYK